MAVVVDLEPVGVPVQHDPLAVGQRHLGAHVLLGGQHRARVRPAVPGRRTGSAPCAPPRARGLATTGCGSRAGPTPRRRAPSARRRAPGPDASSPLATRSAIACTRLPKPCAWLDLRAAAGLALEEPLRRALDQPGQRAGGELDRLVGRRAPAASAWLRSRVPHQVAGSAAGTSGRPSGRRLRRQPGEPLARRPSRSVGLDVGVGRRTPQLADQTRAATAAGAAGPARWRTVDAELVEEPRRLLAVVVGRGDGRHHQPLAGAGAGDVEQPALLGEQLAGGGVGLEHRHGVPLGPDAVGLQQASRADAGRARRSSWTWATTTSRHSRPLDRWAVSRRTDSPRMPRSARVSAGISCATRVREERRDAGVAALLLGAGGGLEQRAHRVEVAVGAAAPRAPPRCHARGAGARASWCPTTAPRGPPRRCRRRRASPGPCAAARQSAATRSATGSAEPRVAGSRRRRAPPRAGARGEGRGGRPSSWASCLSRSRRAGTSARTSVASRPAERRDQQPLGRDGSR